MSLIFSKPEILPSDDKPTAIANKGFPYEKLADNRRFEELIYSLYHQEILAGRYTDRYDYINLLEGVRERGRDCSFHYEGKCVGIIQCKHSIDAAARITKPECAREIIKFVLHAIIDPKLISEAKTFDYYFAVSYGFNEPAKNLLDSFNTLILQEPNLKDWTDKVIKANETLKDLVYTDIETELKRILSEINLHKILPQDLDLLLTTASNENVAPLFFEVRTVIDTRAFHAAVADLKEAIQKPLPYSDETNIPPDVLIRQLKDASFHLANVTGDLEGLDNSHIERPATQALYQWIMNPVLTGEKPIALLAGNAGMGKTVVLRDLMTRLNQEEIPVLGLKADRYYVSSIAELTEKLALDAPLEKVVNTLKVNYERVVILIDQLDALSQSLSARRDYIDTFNLIVNKLSGISNVRVIVSVRLYDLNYDPDLKFYNNQRKFTLQLLPVPEVVHILNRLGVPADGYSGLLLELLRIPHHLNVLCKIYHPALNLQNFNSLHDLYDQLWLQKITQAHGVSSVNLKSLKNCLFTIAGKMYEAQRINIANESIPEEFVIEISYLKSNHILIEEGRHTQFFHQTFYDYVFAKQFIESGNSITDYLTENNQSLFVRSSLKMIIVFLKEQNPLSYIRLLEEILLSGRYRFHLKLLVINYLAFDEEPIAPEVALVSGKILNNRRFCKYFIEALNSSFWLKWCLEQRVFDDLLKLKHPFWKDKFENSLLKIDHIKKLADKFHYQTTGKITEGHLNLIYSALTRQLPHHRQLVIPYLLKADAYADKPRFVSHLLYFTKQWDFAEAFQLFEKYETAFHNDQHGFYKILEDAASSNIDWVIAKYKTAIAARLEKVTLSTPDGLKFDYHDNELVKHLIQADLIKTFELMLEITKALIDKTKLQMSKGEIFESFSFFLYDDDKEYTSDGPHSVLSIFIDTLRKIAQQKAAYFEAFLDEYADTNSAAMLMAIIHGLLTGPSKYPEQILHLCALIQRKGGFNTDGKYQFWLRRLVAASYPLFSQDGKDIINNIYIGITGYHEYDILIDTAGKKSHRLQWSGYTRLQYISSLPLAEIAHQPTVFKEYERLLRKFPSVTIEDREPNKVRVRGVPAPLSDQAYKKMNFEAWKSSFRAYHSDSFQIKYGSKLEHSRAFAAEVKERPFELAPLVEELIDQRSVPDEYIIKGLEGLIDGNFQNSELLKLYKKAIKLDFDREQTLYLVWKADFFIRRQIVDVEILDRLIELASNHPDPAPGIDGSLQKGMNTVRGAAVSRVVDCCYNPDFKDLIFSGLMNVAANEHEAVRVTMLPKLAYLNQLDEERTLQLFLKITDSGGLEVYKISVVPLQYLINYDFGRLVPYLKRLIAVPEMQKEIATVLAVAWISGKPGSSKLLKQILKKGDDAAESVIHVATHNLLDPEAEVQNRCKVLFYQFLNHKSKEVAHEYAVFFLKLEPEHFESLLPLLQKYARSVPAKRNPGYYYQFLIKCAKKHPLECIDLAQYWNTYDRPDISQSSHYENEPVDLVIACYNALRDTTEGKPYINKTLNIFDAMLDDERFRISANRIIELVDR